MQKTSSLAKWGAAVLLLSSLTSCEDILEQYFPKPNPTPPTIPTFPPLGQDIAFYALASGNRLDGFSTANATTRISSVAITGLGSGETLLAIDFRPATGQLYGVSSGSRLYVINQNTGVARALTTEAFRPGLAGNQVAAFDFNPTVDRIRLVTSTGQNLRLNPETGTVAATDGSINGAAGATITGAAYTNNTAGATTTVLYDLDPATDQLYRQDPPNDGTLVAVGALNLNITGDGGFDIDARTGTALGLYPVNGNPTLFTVDLTTGAARSLAQYAASAGYSGIAIPTRPVAYAAAFRPTSDPRINNNSLLIFDPTNPTTLINKPVTGVSAAERLYEIDFRPANGQLSALTNFGRFYTINTATGVATPATPPVLPVVEIDFNPVTDRLRILGGFDNSSSAQVNVTDGTITSDRPTGDVRAQAIAHTNSFVGATSTTEYAIAQGQLLRRSSPTETTYPLVGSLGIEQVASVDFDIAGYSNTAYAIITNGGPSFGERLYTIDLSTGRATVVGTFPKQESGLAQYDVEGLAIGLGF
jgi:hypothetical protein